MDLCYDLVTIYGYAKVLVTFWLCFGCDLGSILSGASSCARIVGSVGPHFGCPQHYSTSFGFVSIGNSEEMCEDAYRDVFKDIYMSLPR